MSAVRHCITWLFGTVFEACERFGTVCLLFGTVFGACERFGIVCLLFGTVSPGYSKS